MRRLKCDYIKRLITAMTGDYIKRLSLHNQKLHLRKLQSDHIHQELPFPLSGPSVRIPLKCGWEYKTGVRALGRVFSCTVLFFCYPPSSRSQGFCSDEKEYKSFLVNKFSILLFFSSTYKLNDQE